MSFCPVCGLAGQPIGPRCERVARYYGYTPQDLAALAARGSSIAVPFFEIKRLFFMLETLARNPLARLMAATVEGAGDGGHVEEHGNLVRVLPFRSGAHPQVREIFVKEDVSKSMVVYRHDDAIEHFGSEERAVLFAELAERFFGLGAAVPPVASGLSPGGTKYVVSAGVPRDRFTPQQPSDGPQLRALWNAGTLPRLALMDFVLGQNDRNPQNVLLAREPAGDEAPLALIDNDDAFGPHERLIDAFAYLAPLHGEGAAGAPPVDLGLARGWFERLSLPALVASLAPLALPREIMSALCGRFVYAAAAVRQALPLERFIETAFTRRLPTAEPLPGRPWADYHSLVSERPDGTHYRSVLGAQLGPREDDGAVWVLEGRALDDQPATIRAVPLAPTDADAGPAVIERLDMQATADGYAELVRRRFFVDGETLRILEIRADGTGWHVVIRRGRLGHYGDKVVERFVSFADEAGATARADELEAELLAAGSSDLRARLEAFKTSGVRIHFF